MRTFLVVLYMAVIKKIRAKLMKNNTGKQFRVAPSGIVSFQLND